jgi:hypothetical protein
MVCASPPPYIPKSVPVCFARRIVFTRPNDARLLQRERRSYTGNAYLSKTTSG